MPFEEILNKILLYRGVQSVIFLDSEGEQIFSYGSMNPEHLKLMGAYQGIVLNTIPRLEVGEHRSVITRCSNLSILTHQLKLGYFICVVLSPDVNTGHAQFQFQDYFTSIENEL